jgi:D-beta-D-heptose 7-phosphate kinase/D-beta-D-heptose 1-phosphate adenosyltransferase
MTSFDHYYPSALAFLRVHPRRTGTLCFTNGCFDLLHPGHVNYLEEVRALGDFLVVGLNSDASVARLKGPGRPFQDERARAMVLCALRSVDAVVLFQEDTPLELITALQPDILAKGGDYTAETVVGREVVEARGGRVVLVPFLPGHSTTLIAERIRTGRGTAT